jgi:hypothetical protein
VFNVVQNGSCETSEAAYLESLDGLVVRQWDGILGLFNFDMSALDPVFSAERQYFRRWHIGYQRQDCFDLESTGKFPSQSMGHGAK